MKKDIERLRDDLSDMLSNLGSYTEEQIEEKRDRLRKATAELQGLASKKIHHASETVQEQGERALRGSREAVNRKPLTTIAVSFAAGLLTAVLMERNRHE